MFQIRWVREAIKEQVAIFEFWNQHNQSPTYSKKIYASLKRAEGRLKKNPFVGSETDHEGVKRILVLKSFSLFYKVQGDVVYILSLWDNRRDPASRDL